LTRRRAPGYRRKRLMSCDIAAGVERPLRPAFLSPSWPAGNAANGIVSYVDRMIPSLRRLRHEPCVLAACQSRGAVWPDVYFLRDQERTPLARAIDPIAFRLSSEHALRRRFAENIVRAVMRARAERGIDLLEMEETFGLAQLIKPRLAIPIVLRLHGPAFAMASWSSGSPASFSNRIRWEGAGIAKADAISAVSREILERTRVLYGLPLHNAIVIPNPAPIVPSQQRWRLADCDLSRILFVGRFDRLKGGDAVIDCMRILIRTFPEIRLWFAGPDNGFTDAAGKSWRFREYLARHAPEATACVDWIGTQTLESLGDLRRRAMVTVVASRYETFCLTALEAMAYGCPLVATRAGGIADMVADSVNGFLCPPGDPAAMAAAIARLHTDPDLAARFGEKAGEDAASNYHPDKIARQTAEFYRQVLDGHRTRPA
jgi:glycosyltransferase involved in cell wall biosynthesis